jgi:hypothetical protein
MRDGITDEVGPPEIAGASRRHLLAAAVAGLGGVVLTTATPRIARAADPPGPPLAAVLPTGKNRRVGGAAVHNAGAGMHVGPDTAMGISTFTINPHSVTCGVGSVGNSPGAVPGTSALPAGLGTSGPFAMMMYATRITSYVVDRSAHSITARGTMRSITAMGGQVSEDVEHPFIAQAFDRHAGAGSDEFFLHFTTPFWNASNPMATRSTLNNAWAMFGSPILFGEINVA